MDWISSTGFVEMLKRFPNTKIRAWRYLDSSPASMYVWEHRDDCNKFFVLHDGKTIELTEHEFLRIFASDLWRPEYFFVIDDEKQRSLAVHLVEYLIMTGNLDWIISECDVQFARQCDHCHKLMNEGWMYGESYHYCSKECLLAENPEMTKEWFDSLAADYDSDIYWTEWNT
ncbi:MAG: hypothetical protein MJZ13_01015 [Bacteroidales bacterium]|nr:hypothetical protein [Bacteroidales bacterium]